VLDFFIGNFLRAFLLMVAYIFLRRPLEVFSVVVCFVMVQVDNKPVSGRIFFIEKPGNFPVKINRSVIIINMQVKGFVS